MYFSKASDSSDYFDLHFKFVSASENGSQSY